MKRLLRSTRRALAAGALLLLPTAMAGAVELGQTDDFESETSEGWTYGQSLIPVVQDAGGPEGAGDAYLEPAATGGGGPNSRLAVYNESQWTGDYPAAGVDAIVLDALHVSGEEVSLRVSLSGPAGTVASALPVVISPGGGWQSYELSLDPADLVVLAGEAGASAVLADATHLRLIHSVATPILGLGDFARADQIAATVGFDNVTAVPEPSALAQGATCALALASLLRRRRRPRAP